MIFYFRLPFFMSQIVLHFLHSTSVFSFHIDVVLKLSEILLNMRMKRRSFDATKPPLYIGFKSRPLTRESVTK